MDEARVLALDHPDVIALASAMADRFPHWRAGWTLPSEAETFVVVYRDGRPVEGAALVVRDDGLAEAMRFSAGAAEQSGGALLTALEQAARDRGAHRSAWTRAAFCCSAVRLTGTRPALPTTVMPTSRPGSRSAC